MKIDSIQLWYHYYSNWGLRYWNGLYYDKITGCSFIYAYHTPNGNPNWITGENIELDWTGFNKYNFKHIFSITGNRTLYSTANDGANGGHYISAIVNIDTESKIVLNTVSGGNIGYRGSARSLHCGNARLYSTELDKTLALDDKDFVNLVNSKQSYAKRMKNKSTLLIDLKEQKAKLELRLS